MSLKVVHINREAISEDAAVDALAKILRQKWDSKAKEVCKSFYAKKGIIVPDEYISKKA